MHFTNVIMHMATALSEHCSIQQTWKNPMGTIAGTARNRKFPGGCHNLLFAEGHSESSLFSFLPQHSSSGAPYYWNN